MAQRNRRWILHARLYFLTSTEDRYQFIGKQSEPPSRPLQPSPAEGHRTTSGSLKGSSCWLWEWKTAGRLSTMCRRLLLQIGFEHRFKNLGPWLCLGRSNTTETSGYFGVVRSLRFQVRLFIGLNTRQNCSDYFLVPSQKIAKDPFLPRFCRIFLHATLFFRD